MTLCCIVVGVSVVWLSMDAWALTRRVERLEVLVRNGWRF